MTSRHRTSRRPKQPTRCAWLTAFVVFPALLGAAAVSPATIQSSASGDGVSRLFAARVATLIRPLVDPMVERVRSEDRRTEPQCFASSMEALEPMCARPFGTRYIQRSARQRIAGVDL